MTVERDKAAAQLNTLSEITSEHPPEPIRGILEAAREELGMDVAFVSEFAPEHLLIANPTSTDRSGPSRSTSSPMSAAFIRSETECGRVPVLILGQRRGPQQL